MIYVVTDDKLAKIDYIIAVQTELEGNSSSRVLTAIELYDVGDNLIRKIIIDQDYRTPREMKRLYKAVQDMHNADMEFYLGNVPWYEGAEIPNCCTNRAILARMVVDSGIHLPDEEKKMFLKYVHCAYKDNDELFEEDLAKYKSFTGRWVTNVDKEYISQAHGLWEQATSKDKESLMDRDTRAALQGSVPFNVALTLIGSVLDKHGGISVENIQEVNDDVGKAVTKYLTPPEELKDL